MVSSPSTGNASIAQFSLDVREVLQARELPQKLMLVILLSLLLESVVCHLCSSFNVPSPQHCLALVGCPIEWGSGVILSLFLRCLCLLSCLLISSLIPMPVTADHELSRRTHLILLLRGEVLWHLELEMLLMYSELSSWKREKILLRGVFTC